MDHDTRPLRAKVQSGPEGRHMLRWFLMAMGAEYLQQGKQQWDPEARRKAQKAVLRFAVVVFACSLWFFIYLFLHG